MSFIFKIIFYVYMLCGMHTCFANASIPSRISSCMLTVTIGASNSLLGSNQTNAREQLEGIQRQLDEVNARNDRIHRKKMTIVLIALFVALIPMICFIVERIKNHDRKKFPKVGLLGTAVVIAMLIFLSSIKFGSVMLLFSKATELIPLIVFVAGIILGIVIWNKRD